MTMLQIVFLLTAGLTLSAAIMVVTARNLVHSALWLVLALFGVAVVYGLLQAGFLAVTQVVVYIGAIAILMIFAIMLTQKIANEDQPRTNENWVWALGLAVIMFAGLTLMLLSWGGVAQTAPQLSLRFSSLQELGLALVSPDQYVLPFELASVLLLAALIGALVIAWERK